MKSIWIAWESQRRNESLARALGAELFEFGYSGSGMTRYFILTRETLMTLREQNPDLIFTQNPSIALSFLVVLWVKLLRLESKVVVDCHNAGVYLNTFQH